MWWNTQGSQKSQIDTIGESLSREINNLVQVSLIDPGAKVATTLPIIIVRAYHRLKT